MQLGHWEYNNGDFVYICLVSQATSWTNTEQPCNLLGSAFLGVLQYSDYAKVPIKDTLVIFLSEYLLRNGTF
jgi:hypothetical protein